MFLIGAAFVAAGYAIAYWGADNIKQWNVAARQSVSDGTAAVPFSILIGVRPYPTSMETGKNKHPVPFAYKATSTSGTGTPSSNSGSGNGAQLNPNYPGGPSGTIPTPGIPT